MNDADDLYNRIDDRIMPDSFLVYYLQWEILIYKMQLQGEITMRLGLTAWRQSAG